MPCIEDWTIEPHIYVQKIFDECQPDGDWHMKLSTFFKEQLSDRKVLNKIPWLNETVLHKLSPNQVVRFRGMVQDMFDPEFYLDTYEVKNENGENLRRPGKYRDIAQCGANEELILDSPKCETGDRKTYYCISIPGENGWVLDSYRSMVPSIEQPSSSYSTAHLKKRSFNHDESTIEDSDMVTCDSKMESHGKQSSESDKRLKDNKLENTTNNDINLVSNTNSNKLNFPLPNSEGVACLLKVYSDVDFRLNDIVEVVGILSTDPSLAAQSEQVEGFLPIPNVEELEAHYPPPSLVPRLHVVSCQTKLHCNPYLPSIVTPGDIPQAAQMRENRELLRSVLEDALLGDGLAAEYLTCHLVSSVYLRQDVMPLGNFGLNLSGISSELQQSHYTKQLYELLQSLTTHSHLLPITLDNMNKLAFVPKKDYQSNRLLTGVLQLPPHFQLVLDETQLQSGQLDVCGVKNLASLGNMINWQKVDYDFQYHSIEQHTNVNVLILSEGKSMIKSNSRVHFEPAHLDTTLAFGKVSSTLTPEVLRQLRTFLTAAKLCPYTLSDSMQSRVQEDFVDSRKNDNGMSADDLHSLLIIARLLSLSCGEQELTPDVWRSAKILEAERKTRLTNIRTEQT